MIFHCKSGHELSLITLLAAPSSSLRCGLEALLEEWSRQHQALLATSEDARKRGYVDIAAIFARNARSLQTRIELLQAGFSKTDSSKLIPVPSRTPMK